MTDNLIVPYKMLIRCGQGLKSGIEFIVKGKIKDDAERVEFNLRHRYGVAFHYQPRFDENVVVRNTWSEGEWNENEERDGDMPFKRGEKFQVIISCEDDYFNVHVGNKLLHTYNHRYTPLEDIDVFEIRGDLTLTHVK